MKTITSLVFLLLVASPLALAEECVQENNLDQQITENINEDEFSETDASIEQLLRVNEKSQSQLTCLEQALASASALLQRTIEEQGENKALIGTQANQTEKLKVSVKEINGDIAELKRSIGRLDSIIQSNRAVVEDEVATLASELDDLQRSLTSDISSVRVAFGKETSQLAQNLSQLELRSENTVADLTELSVDTSANISRLDDYIRYLVIALGVVVFLLIAFFVFLKIYISRKTVSVSEDFALLSESVESNIVGADKKITEVLELIISNLGAHKKSEEDHSLALKVADEIVRIEKNASKMDAKTKGLKQLMASVNRIKDNFSANGYEIVEMLNQPYDERMKVSASFVPSEDLEENEQIITKIIKPQINYKGSMIQAAQIEVSVGE